MVPNAVAQAGTGSACGGRGGSRGGRMNTRTASTASIAARPMSTSATHGTGFIVNFSAPVVA